MSKKRQREQRRVEDRRKKQISTRQKKQTNSEVPRQKGIKHTKRDNLARAQRMRENVVR